MQIIDRIKGFPDSYISFDVETPNKKNDKISQVGLLVYSNGEVSDYSSLINPECEFDGMNKRLTGIKENDVESMPNFLEYWNSVKNLFDQYVLVGHNISFDLSALSKVLEFYGIEMPDIDYFDTMQEFRKIHPEQKSSLKNLCEFYGVKNNKAHDASSDARACHEVFECIRVEIEEPYTTNYQYKKMFSRQPFYWDEDGNIFFSQDHIRKSKLLIQFIENKDTLINVENSNITLTGFFEDRNISEEIEKAGGTIKRSVSGKVNYIVIGNYTNAEWNFEDMGSTIKKAKELIAKGANIKFIGEDTLKEALKKKAVFTA